LIGACATVPNRRTAGIRHQNRNGAENRTIRAGAACSGDVFLFS
jgi:hypothetical protein